MKPMLFSLSRSRRKKCWLDSCTLPTSLRFLLSLLLHHATEQQINNMRRRITLKRKKEKMCSTSEAVQHRLWCAPVARLNHVATSSDLYISRERWIGSLQKKQFHMCAEDEDRWALNQATRSTSDNSFVALQLEEKLDKEWWIINR